MRNEVSARPEQVDRPLLTPSGDAGLERLLAEVVYEGFWEREIGSESIRWGGNVSKVFGYARAEMGETRGWLLERVHPTDVARVEHAARDAIAGDADGFRCDFRFRRKDDSWAWVSARSLIVRDAGGKPLRIVGA